MKRRRFLQAIPAVTSIPALAVQDAHLEIAQPDAVAKPVARFFSAPQMTALRRLSDLILPAIDGTPGAIDAGVPEFLDFLIAESPFPRRTLYRSGLDALNTRAIAKYGKAFTALDDTQAAALLAPLQESWTYQDPADIYAVFLRTAKADILAATVNSREWIAVVSQRNRAAGGIGTYWLPAE